MSSSSTIRTGNDGTNTRRLETAFFALVAAIALALLALPGSAGAANQSVNLDQCANGSQSSPSNCPPGWQNGDLNAQNSFYREGDSVPFRAILTNLASGSHQMVVQYDTTENGKHAYDYLTGFDRTITGADPCDGVSPCASRMDFGPIPVSDNPTVPTVEVPDSGRYFSIWNGTITNVSLGGAADVAGQQQSITVTFTASNPTVVIAWGGHVADELTWPHQTAAGSINGSPYHMRVLSLDGDTSGHQDRSMKAVATAPPTFTTDVESAASPGTFVGSIAPGGSVTDNATLSGTAGPVTGTVSFFACYAATGTPDCTSGGTLVSPAGVPVSSLGTATSGAFSPQDSGTYCFRAEYTPDSQAAYSPANETNVVVQSDGNHGECFTVASGPTLLASSVGTEIDNASGAVDAAPVGSTVHDVATVSGSGDGGTPTGSVTFSSFNGTGCSGDVAATETVALSGGTASSSDATVAEGGLSYRVHYGGSDVYSASDGICENLSSTVVTPPPPPPPPPPPAPPAPSGGSPAPAPATPPTIDLAVTKSAAPNPVSLGRQVTWTMVVTNNGPSAASGVTLADPVPAGMTFVSSSATQGTCSGSPLVTCQLGGLAAGASATVTILTTATTVGSITNTATVTGNESETNPANNTASATVQVKGALVPPVQFCTAVVVSPRSVFVGRHAVLTMRISQHGKAVAGVRVRVKGPALLVLTKASNRRGVVKLDVKPTRAGIVSFRPTAHKSCSSPRIGVVGVFTPPVTG